MGGVRPIVFSREALPPLSVLEGEWRSLEAAGRPSFFTSWQWVGTLLAAVPHTSHPMLLRGRADGATVALALLGANRQAGGGAVLFDHEAFTSTRPVIRTSIRR